MTGRIIRGLGVVFAIAGVLIVLAAAMGLPLVKQNLNSFLYLALAFEFFTLIAARKQTPRIKSITRTVALVVIAIIVFLGFLWRMF